MFIKCTKRTFILIRNKRGNNCGLPIFQFVEQFMGLLHFFVTTRSNHLRHKELVTERKFPMYHLIIQNVKTRGFTHC